MMHKTNSKIIINRLIIIAIITLLALNFIVLVAYVEHNQAMQLKRLREQSVQKMVEIVDTGVVNVSELQQIITAATKDPNLNISISKKPLWLMRFEHREPRWEIYRTVLRDRHGYASLSYKLGHGKWLNIKLNPYLRIEHITFWVIIIGLISTLFIFFYMWSIQRFIKPLNQLKAAAENLGVEMHPSPLPVYGPSMVKATLEAMNKMQQRIVNLLKERTLTLAALSHDLRTPLTRLKLKTPLLKDAEQRASIEKDLDEMQNMLTNTLAFARHNYQASEHKQIDLCSLLDSLTLNWQSAGKNVSYKYTERKVIVDGDAVLLKRAFNNIINNALKYGSLAEVALATNKDNIIITIKDNGPGISQAEQEKVFSPFYIGDKARSQNKTGIGLGLAIAKSVIAAHHGEITIANNADIGLCVTIVIPLAVTTRYSS